MSLQFDDQASAQAGPAAALTAVPAVLDAMVPANGASRSPAWDRLAADAASVPAPLGEIAVVANGKAVAMARSGVAADFAGLAADAAPTRAPLADLALARGGKSVALVHDWCPSFR